MHVIYFFYREVGNINNAKYGNFNFFPTIDSEDRVEDLETIPESRLIYLKLKYGF